MVHVRLNGLHRPSQLRSKKGKLNIQYIVECCKLARLRTDRFLLRKRLEQLDRKEYEERVRVG